MITILWAAVGLALFGAVGALVYSHFRASAQEPSVYTPTFKDICTRSPEELARAYRNAIMADDVDAIGSLLLLPNGGMWFSREYYEECMLEPVKAMRKAFQDEARIEVKKSGRDAEIVMITDTAVVTLLVELSGENWRVRDHSLLPTAPESQISNPYIDLESKGPEELVALYRHACHEREQGMLHLFTPDLLQGMQEAKYGDPGVFLSEMEDLFAVGRLISRDTALSRKRVDESAFDVSDALATSPESCEATLVVADMEGNGVKRFILVKGPNGWRIARILD